jgi:hypothetical protein
MDKNYAGEDLKPTLSLARPKNAKALSAKPPRVMPRNRKMGNPKGSSSRSKGMFPLGRSEGVLNGDSSMLSADPAATVMLKMRELEQQQMRTRKLLQQRPQQDVLDDAYLALANASSSESMLGSVPYSLVGGRLGLDRQQDILDDAYLAVANASLLGSLADSLAGGRLGLNHQQDVLEDACLAAFSASSSESMLGSTSYSRAGDRLGLDEHTQALLQKRLQMKNRLLPPHSFGLDSISKPHPNFDPTVPNLHVNARFGGDTEKRNIHRAPYFDATQAPEPPSGEEDPDAEQNYSDDKVEAKYGGTGEPFPQKLYRMLEEVEKADQEDVLSFSPDGRAFAIHKPDIFTEDILPRYFSTTRISSFQCQLHHYGFQRILTGQNKGYYYHKFFWKGQKGLLKKIGRRKSSGRKLTSEDLEEVVRAYQEAPPRAGFDIGIPASQFTMQDSVPYHDLISESLMMNGGHQSRLGNRPPDLVDGLLSRQQDLISQILTTRGEEQPPERRNSLSRLPPRLLDELSSRQQDLISQSLRMYGGGQSPGVGNSLSGLRSSVTEGLSHARLSFESLIQGDNGAMRSRLLAARSDVSGQSGDPTTAELLRELKESELLLAQLEERRRRLSNFS